MFRNKCRPARGGRPTSSAALATYPTGNRLAGVGHDRTIERISRSARASGAPQCETMTKSAALMQELVRRPDGVELTTQLVTDLGEGRRWLEANRLESEARQYGAILGELAEFWDQSGALERYRESLR